MNNIFFLFVKYPLAFEVVMNDLNERVFLSILSNNFRMLDLVFNMKNSQIQMQPHSINISSNPFFFVVFHDHSDISGGLIH